MPPKIKVYIFLFISFIGTHYVIADSNPVIMDGIAVIERNNIASARASAIEDAQKKAINQFISGMIPADLIVSNYKILEEKIFSRAVSFVKSFKVLAESREGEIFRVKVEIYLINSAIENALSEAGLLFTKGEYPRVLAMISEQTIDGRFLRWWGKDGGSEKGISEEGLKNWMKQKGFTVIEPEIVLKKIGDENISVADFQSIEELAKFGRIAGADVLIYGETVLRKGNDVEGSTLKSYYAKLSVKGIYVDTGKIIFETSEEAGGIHRELETSAKNAIKKVSDIIGEKITEIIERFWKEEVIKIKTIFLEIRNPERVDDIETLLSAVQKVKNVKHAEVRSFSHGISTIEAEVLNISPEILSLQIQDNLTRKNRFHVLDVKSDRIIFNINKTEN